ncbi:hypothetical protein HXZ66_17710 [Bacillus sp. A116_S68]|nr:hypothetical protein HXZ66_17710 [Bacillus sp. A116_S68]
MPELKNCPNCDKLFVKALRPVCDACAREVEDKFETVYTFIRKRENRRASIEEVHEATEVEIDLIMQFVREGRLHLSQFPNLTYPCEKCGAKIREARLCANCRDEINEGLQVGEKQKAFEDRKRDRERARYQTYSALGDKVRREKP